MYWMYSGISSRLRSAVASSAAGGSRRQARAAVTSAAAGGYTGITLAVAITTSGLAYLLLLQDLAIMAVPAGVLLLVFITGTGIALGASAGNAPITS
jgi:hypothetical protein